MPHTDTTPVSASVASTGKGLVYTRGGYWAGWSGELTTTNASPTTVFKFTSPYNHLKAIITWGIDKTLQDYNKLIGLDVTFNGSTVMIIKGLSNWSDGGQIDLIQYEIIIPTNTEVEIIVSTTDVQAIPMTVTIVANEL
tara:strand:- start:42 stop:458 length:417 start_codon:yes stop_codon:yes gene_type:complete